MTEQEILDQIEEVEHDRKNAKRKLASAKKLLMDMETKIIELNLQKAKLMEDLRVFKLTSIIQPKTPYELEIERFRQNNPEICAFAKDRDTFKGK